MPPLARKPGDVVAGRFKLERKLGQGGMGSVWIAHHLGLKVRVAVKFMDAAYERRDKQALARFTQEATAAASIQSPNVVRILDFGHDDKGLPYLAMELLEGEDLERRILREGRLPLEDVRKIVVETCAGLSKAPAAGILHRDLKPENLFLAKEDGGSFTVKILDFGIAKAFGQDVSVNLTATGQMLGTPIFMSPEQAMGNTDIDLRSDLYGVGLVVYNCLSGHLPFEESNAVGELIVAIATKPTPSITRFRKDLPPKVVGWIEKALAKDRKDRFASAKEMGDAFVEACEVRRMMVTFTDMDVDTTQPPEVGLLAPPIQAGAIGALEVEAAKRLPLPEGEDSRRTTSRRKRRRGDGPRVAQMIVGGVLLLAIGVGIGLWLSRFMR
jgi:serine/threonine-protein kinase